MVTKYYFAFFSFELWPIIIFSPFPPSLLMGITLTLVSLGSGNEAQHRCPLPIHLQALEQTCEEGDW